jgi:diguanylate cyclase (GGDEF)-like protein/PAS domain S-box-containing protein
MDVLAHLGLSVVVRTAGRECFAEIAFFRPAWSWIYVHWTFLTVLACMSATTSAAMNRLCKKTGIRKRDDETTVRELAMLRTVFDNLPDPIYVKDLKSRFLLANQAAANNMGAAMGADLLGKTDFDFFPEELAASFFEDERQVLLSGQSLISREEHIKESNGQTRYLLSTKVPFFDAEGRTIGIVGIGRNITALKAAEAELKRTQEALKFKADHDCLTLLLNRGAIMDMLSRELDRSVRENSSTTIMLGDLDHFKNINDLHGHPIGDQVLREVACRILGTVRTYDLVGRFGGEEFLAVLPGCASEDALARADQLRAAIEASPIPTARGAIPVTISIGVLAARDWGNPTTEEVLREVDAALYAAKAAGRNCSILAAPQISVCAVRGLYER